MAPELKRALVSVIIGGWGVVIGTVGLSKPLGVGALVLGIASLLISWAAVGAIAYFLSSYQVELATILSVGTAIASIALGVVAILVSLNILLPIRINLPQAIR